jgi:glycosyltransferase involved in cell wall biosynthesis
MSRLVKFKFKLHRTSQLFSRVPSLIQQYGSIGKAYQAVRRQYKLNGFKAAKQLIRGELATHIAFISRKKGYSRWHAIYDTPTTAMEIGIRQKISTFQFLPLISVVMPCYNPNPQLLKEAILSVQQQLYENWELCIADDCSTDPAVRQTLAAFAAQDTRIKVVFRKTNGHICLASNSALELVTGQWVVLMDHNDTLHKHALAWIVRTINDKPEAQLIYSDEDKIDLSGKRSDPNFKPDWNLDLFYGYNLCSHLGVFRHHLIQKVGGFRPGFEGSQDYDLVLRIIEHIDHRHIVHIPQILYHWRIHPKSTASDAEAKPYAALAGVKALNEHLKRTNTQASAHLTEHNHYKVQYQVPRPEPLVSIIIPTRNGLDLLKNCIDSITQKTSYPNYEVLVIDNNSDDAAVLAYFQHLQTQHANIRVLADPRPFNYSQLNNFAVMHARGEILSLLNNDTEVIQPDWLCEMVSLAVQPRIGAVGAKLLYPDGTVQHAGVIMGLGGVAGHVLSHIGKDDPGYFARAILRQGLSAVTAACLVIRKSVFLEVGGLNETSLKVAYNDVDFCLKVKTAGYQNVYAPDALLYHHESISRGQEDTPEKQLRFQQEQAFMRDTWAEIIAHDPAYNPNLSLSSAQCDLASPPRTTTYNEDTTATLL